MDVAFFASAPFFFYVHAFATEMEGRARPELRDYDSECRTLGDVHGAQIREPFIRAPYSTQTFCYQF